MARPVSPRGQWLRMVCPHGPSAPLQGRQIPLASMLDSHGTPIPNQISYQLAMPSRWMEGWASESGAGRNLPPVPRASDGLAKWLGPRRLRARQACQTSAGLAGAGGRGRRGWGWLGWAGATGSAALGCCSKHVRMVGETGAQTA
jgi:hypothetical protein